MVVKSGFYSIIPVTGQVPRTAIVQKMKKISAKKNIFMSAPGGYGKSIAAAQWLSSIRGNTAKMIIRQEDNNPEVFYKRLASILVDLTKMKKGLPFPLDKAITFDRLIDVINLLPAKNTRHYLLIDDLHIINSEEIINRVPVISASLPENIRRCLVSRSEPPAVFMETGMFDVITKEDLLFSPEEVEWLGAEKDFDLSSAQIKELLDTTGGWVMYLSALLSSGKATENTNPAENKPQKNKVPQTLTQYLDARVWKLWDNETKTLLLKLAVPNEITPDLCKRLTEKKDSRSILEKLTKKENAFLSLAENDTYRFHDIFHDFLLERMTCFLSKEEIQRLNGIAAQWYYEQGDYYEGAKHYIQNKDHSGINRCINATNHYHESSGNLSVEVRLNFTTQFIKSLPSEFIAENPFLITRSAVAAHNNGDTNEFARYTDLLYEKMPSIAVKYPELIKTIVMFMGVDYRMSMREYVGRIAKMMAHAPKDSAQKTGIRVGTMTQNLPFFHRSFRDLSDVHELKDEDINPMRNTFGLLIGENYSILEKCAFAGFGYEHGNLLDAARYALEAFNACDEETYPEITFHAHAILESVLYAMGSIQEAGKIMALMEDNIERNAQFLRVNFKAIQTERFIRDARLEAAKEWLAVYACHNKQLPFYQICRHFTTMRSFIAIGNFAAAVQFGKRLMALATDYRRPLDQIECGILTAIALRHSSKKDDAAAQLAQSVKIAAPYGFTQLFINDGKEILPILWELKKNMDKDDDLLHFTDRLANDIYKRYNLNAREETTPALSPQQLAMLPYLNKGMTYSEIAKATGVERSTVKYHVLQCYKRLNVHDAQEAIVKAKMLGLLT